MNQDFLIVNFIYQFPFIFKRKIEENMVKSFIIFLSKLINISHQKILKM